MFELIIIVVVVIVAIGFLKGLRPEDRGAVIRSVVKGTAQGVAYSAKVVKSGSELAYYTGNNLGLKVEIEGADMLKDVRDWESANVSPVKDGVKAADTHMDNLGVNDAIKASKIENKELADKLGSLLA